MGRSLALAFGGLGAGLLSGLLGVGGGIVMVPVLVLAGLSQHRAHATSLAAIAPIAAVGAFTYGLHGEVDYGVALLLAVGAIVGAPLGAKVMATTAHGMLRILFGLLTVAVALRLLA